MNYSLLKALGIVALAVGAAALKKHISKNDDEKDMQGADEGKNIPETDENTTADTDILLMYKKLASVSKDDNMRKLREHYGNDIVFGDMLDMHTKMKRRNDKELLANEICAYGYTLGCYDILMTERLYRDDVDCDYTEKKPANRKQTAETRENLRDPSGCRSVTEIYAKHIGSGKYKLICDAACSMLWWEAVFFIGTVKKNVSVSDNEADLIVLKQYSGEYNDTDYWFVFDRTEKTKSYKAIYSEDDSEKSTWCFEGNGMTGDEYVSDSVYFEAEKRKDFKTLSNDELMMYVPDVYQKSIYPGEECHIDFAALKANGIKFLSFDIDDTIIGLENRILVPKKAKYLFRQLKRDFKVVLFSNGSHDRVKHVAKELGIEWIARAGKPSAEAFQKMKDRFGFEKSEMAHIGNNLVDDVRGGNCFGITTCLVRRKGRLTNIPSTFGYTGGKYLRKVLKERDIWHKHHKFEENDQYYQLGNKPIYRYHR